MFFCATLLAGCGFQPLLGRQTGASVTDNLAAIRVAPIPDRSGQLLRNALLDSLTPRGAAAVAAQYTLSIRLQEPRQTIALRRDDVISRSSYAAVATFDLVDRQGRKIATGTSTFTTDYEITVSEYATRASLEDARSRVLVLIADDIRNQLALALKRPASGG